MNQLEVEVHLLKSEVNEMWQLILSQLTKTKACFTSMDKDLAREVVANEKRVNAHELYIDKACENIFALFNPVAVDLRYVLAVLKINSNLERIGDNIEGIASFSMDSSIVFNQKILDCSQVMGMFDVVHNMLTDVLGAFTHEDTTLARGVFKKDAILDTINLRSNDLIATCMLENTDLVEQGLYILSIIKKLERIVITSRILLKKSYFILKQKS